MLRETLLPPALRALLVLQQLLKPLLWDAVKDSSNVIAIFMATLRHMITPTCIHMITPTCIHLIIVIYFSFKLDLIMLCVMVAMDTVFLGLVGQESPLLSKCVLKVLLKHLEALLLLTPRREGRGEGDGWREGGREGGREGSKGAVPQC